MFFTRKKEEAINAKFSNLTIDLQKLEGMVRNSFDAIREESKLNNSYLNEFNNFLLGTHKCLVDTDKTLADLSQNIKVLTDAVDAEKLVNLGDVATELRRIVKVVDVLNDTIRENILNEGVSLPDIDQ